MRYFLSLLAVVAAAAALASSAGAAGETITIGMSSGALDANGGGVGAADLDPAVGYLTQLWQLHYITCAKLFNYSDEAAPQGNQIEPEVATALPIVSNLGLTYTFTLRSGFGFSSPAGEEVTAASFDRTIQRLKDPGVASPGSGYAADIAGVVAVGNTLEITLTAPDPGLIHRLTMPFFCAAPSTAPLHARASALLGSAGPYYVSSLPANQVVVERNPNYGGTRIRNIGTFIYQLDSANRVAETLAGTIDVSPFLGAPEVQSITLPEPRLISSPSNGVFHLALNTSSTPFDVLTTRSAASYAIDRTAVSAVKGWIPTDQMLAPTMPGYQETSLYPLTAQTATAQALLGGATPAVHLCFQGSNPTALANNLPIANVVRANLQAAGFVVTLAPTTFNGLVSSADCEASVFGWVPDMIDGAGALTPILSSTGSFSPSHFSGADAQLAAAQAILDPVNRAAAFSAIDVDVSGNATPMANLGIIRNNDLVSSRIGCRIQQPAYGLDLHRLCIEVTNPSVPPGGTVSTDTGTGATAQAPLQTGLDLPDGVGGSVTITQGVDTSPPPSGYSLLEQQLDISAPPGTVASPITLSFEIDAALLPVAGVDGVIVRRNGVEIVLCTDPTQAIPDPCVASRTTQADGDGVLIVRTSHASLWSFAVASAPFAFEGFDPPMNSGLNDAKAGSTVPVRFSLGGDFGLAILPSAPTSIQLAGCTSATTGSAVPVAFEKRLELHGKKTYEFHWKTDKAWKGQCRRLDVAFVDGTTHSASFGFR